MARLKVYSVKDSKAEAFMQPIFVQAEGVALRNFTDTIRDPEQKHPISKHPEDYIMFKIGEWEETTGQFEAIEPEVLIAGHSITVE